MAAAVLANALEDILFPDRDAQLRAWGLRHWWMALGGGVLISGAVRTVGAVTTGGTLFRAMTGGGGMTSGIRTVGVGTD